MDEEKLFIFCYLKACGFVLFCLLCQLSSSVPEEEAPGNNNLVFGMFAARRPDTSDGALVAKPRVTE